MGSQGKGYGSNQYHRGFSSLSLAKRYGTSCRSTSSAMMIPAKVLNPPKLAQYCFPQIFRRLYGLQGSSFGALFCTWLRRDLYRHVGTVRPHRRSVYSMLSGMSESLHVDDGYIPMFSTAELNLNALTPEPYLQRPEAL